GSASFGVRIDAPDGVADLDLYSSLPFEGSMAGVGVLLFKADKSFWFGIGITGGISGDRLIVDAGGLRATLPDAPQGLAYRVADGATDATCGYDCMYFQLRTTDGRPATWYVVAWAAGLGGPTAVEVHGNAGTTATFTQGTSLALGDEEIQHGTLDVQVQKRLVGFHGVGAKAMVEAAATAEVAQALYGFWGFNNVKFVCAGTCVAPNSADAACFALGVGSCDPTRVSWQGPSGGGANQQTYSFLGTPAGFYTFQVDRKLDAYQPGGGVAVGGVFAVAYENTSALSIADVALPP
ncbi:MAG TPA: hypothetical protein VGR28_10075, partial [Candidatus Thermoplasmatota archaeon]|nr:hypothetical protein [Candidatus Thermoplasmatota archaeon]